MQDLKDVTNNVHYENYRTKKLSSVTTTSNDGKTKVQTKYAIKSYLSFIFLGLHLQRDRRSKLFFFSWEKLFLTKSFFLNFGVGVGF